MSTASTPHLLLLLLPLALSAGACDDADYGPGSGVEDNNNGGENNGTDNNTGENNANGEPDILCGLSCPLATNDAGEPFCACAIPEDEPECVADDECVLVTNFGLCCPCRLEPYPRAIVDAEPCLAESNPGEGCRPEGCEDGCASIGCVQPEAVVCFDGRCVAQ